MGTEGEGFSRRQAEAEASALQAITLGLREDFLQPAGLTANALAKRLHVPAPRINDIVRERRGVSADTAMRLARYFGGDARSWLNLQAIYDLRLAEMANARKIEREIVPIAV